jgi:hypothetical protein
MLKVNLKKISLEEFVVKYHLFPVISGGEYTTLTKGNENGTIAVEDEQYHVWITAEVDYGDCEATLDDDTLSLLFDMISNGDVIKEENKNDA